MGQSGSIEEELKSDMISRISSDLIYELENLFVWEMFSRSVAATAEGRRYLNRFSFTAQSIYENVFFEDNNNQLSHFLPISLNVSGL